jgi:hypothetical protein
LREAGLQDAAPGYLDDTTWSRILSLRTDDEIVEMAVAKAASRPGQRTGLKYLAPMLLEPPQCLDDSSAQRPAGRSPPRDGPMTREDSRRIAATTRLSDFREACAAEQRGQTDDDSRTIEADASRLLG